MQVFAPHDAVGKFFQNKPIYSIPKYQRGYAWGKTEIDDFIKDLEACFNARVGGNELKHFFGSIVCVKSSVQGTISTNKFELVDGQQRLATFVMLVGALIQIYNELKAEAIVVPDNANEQIIEGRIEAWNKRFIEFNNEVQRVNHTFSVLTMSLSDNVFFNQTIRGGNPVSSRDSHLKINYAFNSIKDKLTLLTQGATLSGRIDNLEKIQNIIDNDFSILRVETDTSDNAIRLFQVLNDRGKSLSEGDLLRARTMEMLEGYSIEQDLVEVLWDEILADSANKTTTYLRWIYNSHKGSKAGKSTLYDDFLDYFFPMNSNDQFTPAEATMIKDMMQVIANEISLCRKLLGGVWPYPAQLPIEAWDRSRLGLLITSIGHTLSIPLLLASMKLTHTEFSEIINTIERFVFRYITISGQHPSAVSKIYNEECLAIRTNPAAYNSSTLFNKLRALQNLNSPIDVFKSNLDTLVYKKGGGNKSIKYFLITVEGYLSWYNKGAARGVIKNEDRSFYYVFSDMTIEHIYPRNAHGVVKVLNMEPLRNTLGNLTFMGPTPNGLGANDDFITKKPIFQASPVLMNREIDSNNLTWTDNTINLRSNALKDIAEVIFTI